MTTLQFAFGLTLFAGFSSLFAVQLAPDPGQEAAVLFSALLATGNALCALGLSYVAARGRSMKVFFGAVLGGMMLRMGTTLLGFVVGLKILLLPALTFALALLAYTLVFIAAETALWSKQGFTPRVQNS